MLMTRGRRPFRGQKRALDVDHALPVNPRLYCKTQKYRLNKILAKLSSPSALVRDTVVKQMGGPLSESVEVDVVPRVREHRTLQRPLESWVSRCERVLQHNPPISGPFYSSPSPRKGV
jgi:hypothetical protein